MKCLNLFLLTFLLLLLINHISAQSADYYCYTPSGKVTFSLSTDYLNLRFNQEMPTDEQLSFLHQWDDLNGLDEKDLLFFNEHLYVKLPADISKSRVAALLNELQHSNTIVSAIPMLMMNNGKRCSYDEQFVVGLNETSDLDLLRQMATLNQVELVKQTKYDELQWFLKVTPQSGGDAMTMANVFAESGLFDYAEVDFIYFSNLSSAPAPASVLTTDPLYAQQWHLENTGTYPQLPPFNTADADIDAEAAWMITTGNPNIRVAVIDDGVDTNNADLMANLEPGYDATAGGETVSMTSVVGHGNSVAELIAAEGNNNIGGVGVAYDCKVIPIKIFVPFGVGALTRNSWDADAIDWAWQEGNADVLNNSWGGGAPSALISNALDRAFMHGRSGLGALSLFSAGNDDANGVEYPANLTNVIAVAATNSCDYRRRPTNAPSCDGSVDWGSNYGIELDVAAPGNLIQTSSGAFSGTSASCPITAGIVALILSKNPSLTATQARFYLESTCEKVNYTYLNNIAGHPNGSWTLDLGYGRVNAALALAAVPTPHPNDLGVVAIAPPANSCSLGMSETVTITIKNYSFNTLSGIPLEYRIKLNSGSFTAWTSIGNYTGGIPPFSEVTHSFTIDASMVGEYTIEARTQAIGDLVALNDADSAVFVHRATISSYPYLEDFESNNGGWYTSPANNPFQWGVPSTGNNFINTVGSGNSCWYTNAPGSSSHYFPSQTEAYLYSPCFDFSTLTSDPILSFLLIYSLPNLVGAAEDYVYMEFSTNDGNGWTRLGMQGSGTNWYNNTDGWTESTQNGAGNWINSQQALTGTAGFSNVQLRFVFPSNGDIPTEEGFAVDKIEIKEPLPDDASVSAIISPINDCDLSNMEIVKVNITNLGANLITACPVEYRYDHNGMGFTSWASAGSYNGMIASGAEDVFTFNVDFSLKGTYVLEVRTQLLGDGDAGNDTATQSFEHYTAVNTYPYADSFEAGQGFWLTGGTNSSWDIGNPSGNHISTAADGFTAWVTNLTGIPNDGEQSYVQSPCFDFSALTSPQINMAIWWDNYTDGDGARLEYSTDGGVSWAALGSFNEPNNWYNSQFVNGLGYNAGWSGTAGGGSGGWVTASHGLSTLSGQQQVLFRIYFGEDLARLPTNGLDGFAFDNIIISESNSADAGVLTISSPAPLGCFLGNSETVTISIKNFGVTDIMNIPVEYRLDYDNGGFGPWMPAGTYVGTITSGNSATHTFAADFSQIGTYVLEVKTTLAADANSNNDIASYEIEHIANSIIFFPHCEDFEFGFNGWQPKGVSSSWETGVPANTIINSAAGGTKVCATSLNGDYNLNESSYLLSPCIDLSMFNFGVISFDVWYETEAAKDGLKLQYTINGGTTWVTETIQTNAYNTPTITSFATYDSQDGWAGSSGGWLHAQASISPLGSSNVFYRFVFVADGQNTKEGVAIDNICFYEEDNNNISSIAACNTYQLYGVSGNNEFHIVDPTGSIIGKLAPNGNNLGKVTIEVNDMTSVPQANGGVYYLPRYFNFKCTGGADCPSSGNFPQGNVDVTLFFESQELAVYNTAASSTYLYSDLYGTHYDGANENCNLNDNTGGTYSLLNKNNINSLDYNMGAGFTLGMSLAAFSEIGVHGTNTVLSPNAALPIELLDFSAKLLTKETVMLKWITALEENTDEFIIQRSINGRDFENIGTVNAKGQSFEPITYQFIDQNPIRGKNYYRLKMVDNDDYFTYSNLEWISLDGTKNIRVWPIPFEDIMQYEFYYTNTEKIELNIIGIDGKRWKHEQITVHKGQNRGQLQLNKLPKGIYTLIVKGEKDRITPVKIIKYR